MVWERLLARSTDDIEAEEAPNNNRILALSDGVFAFAMTLLVLGIPAPDPANVQTSQLAKYVASQGSAYFVWVLSFLVIGTFWSAHHRLFKDLHSHDETLVFLNLVVLLSVAFMPYPTTLIGRYSDSQFAVILYACSLFVTSSAMTLISLRALRSPALVRSDAARARVRTGMIRGLSLQAVCLVSIAVSFVDLGAALLCWALIPVAQKLAIMRLTRRSARMAGSDVQ